MCNRYEARKHWSIIDKHYIFSCRSLHPFLWYYFAQTKIPRCTKHIYVLKRQFNPLMSPVYYTVHNIYSIEKPMELLSNTVDKQTVETFRNYLGCFLFFYLFRTEYNLSHVLLSEYFYRWVGSCEYAKTIRFMTLNFNIFIIARITGVCWYIFR